METANSRNEQPAARIAEQFLIDLATPLLSGESRNAEVILTTTMGRAHLARALAAHGPHVDCWLLDQFQADLVSNSTNSTAAGTASKDGATQSPLVNAAHLHCTSDPPDRICDWAMIPLGRQGETELIRETFQSFFVRLKVGGKLWVAVDNPQDRWVREQLERFGLRIRTHRAAGVIAYEGEKLAALKKRKQYDCEFMFRDRGRKLHAASRPGVFSHRRIDPGARHLINAMQIEPGDRVLEMGCGAGLVSIAAAAIDPAVQVHAFDCNVRAVACTRHGAELNGLPNLAATLSTTGPHAGTKADYDVFLGNPPYYADFRIAQLFLDTAIRTLRPGGRAYFVGKRGEWYEEHMLDDFEDLQIQEVKSYILASGRRTG